MIKENIETLCLLSPKYRVGSLKEAHRNNLCFDDVTGNPIAFIWWHVWRTGNRVYSNCLCIRSIYIYIYIWMFIRVYVDDSFANIRHLWQKPLMMLLHTECVENVTVTLNQLNWASRPEDIVELQCIFDGIATDQVEYFWWINVEENKPLYTFSVNLAIFFSNMYIIKVDVWFLTNYIPYIA